MAYLTMGSYVSRAQNNLVWRYIVSLSYVGKRPWLISEELHMMSFILWIGNSGIQSACYFLHANALFL